MCDELVVSIRITDQGCPAELSPEAITEDIGLRPTKAWEKGRKLRTWPIEARVSGWELESGLERTVSLKEHVEALKAKVKPAAGTLARLAEKWDANLWIVRYVKGYGSEIDLDAEWVRWASALGLGIVVDAYCLDED